MFIFIKKLNFVKIYKIIIINKFKNINFRDYIINLLMTFK